MSLMIWIRQAMRLVPSYYISILTLSDFCSIRNFYMLIRRNPHNKHATTFIYTYFIHTLLPFLLSIIFAVHVCEFSVLWKEIKMMCFFFCTLVLHIILILLLLSGVLLALLLIFCTVELFLQMYEALKGTNT